MGEKVEGVFGNMDMTARKRAVGMFRKRKIRFLVVTDVAARGLDIPLEKRDQLRLSAKCKLFVHRAGRGSTGSSGYRVQFCGPN